MIISDYGKVVTGKTPITKNKDYWGGNIPFVTPGDIQATKHIFSTSRYITKSGFESVSTNIKLPKDAVCVSCIGNIGYVGKTTTECISNQQINSIIVDSKHNSDYVYYVMKSLWPFFKNYEGQSTTLSILNKNQFSKIKVPELSRIKEDYIAKILNSLDDKIELNKQINKNLQTQADTIFSKAYNASTDQQPFTSAIKVLGGGTPKTGDSDYWNGSIPFFTPKDVGDPYAFHTEKYITESGLEHCNSRLYPINTSFVTARGTVGKVSLAGTPMAMNQSCYALVSDVVDPLMVYFYALKAITSLKHKASGAVFDAIVTRDFDTEVIHVLSGSDSQRVIEAITPMMKTIHNNATENIRLSELRDALLPRLMSGEIDVSDIDL